MQLNATAFIVMFASVFGLWCQVFIAMDLILTIHRPFTPKESRMPIYLGIAFIFSLFQGIILTWFHKMGEVNLTVKIGAIFAQAGIVFMWLVSLASIIYVVVKLCKPGISSKIRRKVMIRHVTAIIFFNITEFYNEIGIFMIFAPKYRTLPTLIILRQAGFS